MRTSELSKRPNNVPRKKAKHYSRWQLSQWRRDEITVDKMDTTNDNDDDSKSTEQTYPTRIEPIQRNLKTIRRMNEDDNDIKGHEPFDVAPWQGQIALLTAQNAELDTKITEDSNKFYTLIPQHRFKHSSIRPIKSKEEIAYNLTLMQQLNELHIAICLVLGRAASHTRNESVGLLLLWSAHATETTQQDIR